MSRRSPLPDSSGRYRDSEDGDRYRSRRGDTDGYRRSVDGDSRDGRRDRRVPERDTRRDHRDDRRRRDDADDRRRTRDDYDGRDDGRRRRDGSRDNRYSSRHDDDRDRSRREDYRDRDRGNSFRDDRDRGDRDGERGGSSRRSASPRRSGPHSHSTSAPPPEDKAKPNFAPSGLLAAATNTVKHADATSTLLKYNEPPEARKPLVGWRLYVFKGDEQVGVCTFSLLPSWFPSTFIKTNWVA
jgi:smad nuclear-interacting protein 1